MKFTEKILCLVYKRNLIKNLHERNKKLLIKFYGQNLRMDFTLENLSEICDIFKSKRRNSTQI